MLKYNTSFTKLTIFFLLNIQLKILNNQAISTESLSGLLILKLVVCILLRVLGQVQGFRLTQHM
jgi:hypothetical protein